MVECLQPKPDLDLAFAALADPTRRAIVQHLARGEASISELARPLPISLQAVSKHIGVLEAAGIVARRRIGRTRRVRLHGAPITAVSDWARELEAFWNTTLDALQRHVEAAETDPSAAAPAPSRKGP